MLMTYHAYAYDLSYSEAKSQNLVRHKQLLLIRKLDRSYSKQSVLYLGTMQVHCVTK